MRNDRPEIRAFLFDLDGTLLDTEILWVEAFEVLLAARDLPIGRALALEIVYGWSWPDVYARASQRYPSLWADFAAFENALRVEYSRLLRTRDVVIRGSVELLRRLAREYPVAVVTGALQADLDHALERLAIRDCIRFALCAGDFSPGKPDPACYLLAARKLQVLPRQCLAFEDSTAGIRAATSAGMVCVALQRPDRPAQDTSPAELALADLALFDPAEWT